MIRKPYPPGRKGKRPTRALSEYGRELREKQKLRFLYNLKEKQFRKYVKQILEKRGTAKNLSDLLIKTLERRLDNVVFRLGLASTRAQARQLVSHCHFLVNGKKVNIPSYQVNKGDKISVSESSRKKNIFKNLSLQAEKKELPSWVSTDFKKLEGKIKSLPSLTEVAPPVELPMIFEFYSR